MKSVNEFSSLLFMLRSSWEGEATPAGLLAKSKTKLAIPFLSSTICEIAKMVDLILSTHSLTGRWKKCLQIPGELCYMPSLGIYFIITKDMVDGYRRRRVSSSGGWISLSMQCILVWLWEKHCCGNWKHHSSAEVEEWMEGERKKLATTSTTAKGNQIVRSTAK